MRIALCLVATLGAVLVACGDTAARPEQCEAEPRTVVVYAASSLREGFDALADEIAAVPCEPDVVFEYGSSGALAAKIVNGSPAAIFVSAGASAMATVVDAGAATRDPVEFLVNDASLMVSSRSERLEEIRSVDDLLSEGLVVGLCVGSAPCGALADDVLAKATRASGRRIDRATVADTESASSADLITKITLGEIDAGIVLSSECVSASSRAVCRALPTEISASTTYSVAALADNRTVLRITEAIRSTVVVDALVDGHGFSRLPG